MRGRSARHARAAGRRHVVAGDSAPRRPSAGIRPSTSLPVVDLPQPDSPTRPERAAGLERERDAVDRAQASAALAEQAGWPRRTCSARDRSRGCEERARGLEQAGRRSARRDAGGAMPAGRRAGWPAARSCSAARRADSAARRSSRAAVRRAPAPCREWRRGGGAGRRGRQRGQQALRVGMRGRVEEVLAQAPPRRCGRHT